MPEAPADRRLDHAFLLAVDASLGPEVSPWMVAARHSGHPYSTDGYFLLTVAWQTAALLVTAWLTARVFALEYRVRTRGRTA